MYCTSCDYSKKIKPKKIVHKYIESGLDSIVLSGVSEAKCPKCGEIYLGIPNMVQLHEIIKDILITKSKPLSGVEVRFLRKQIGYSGKKFADLIGQSHEHVSRIENGKESVGKAFDRAVRLAVFSKKPDRDYDLHDAIAEQPTVVPKNMEFKQTRHHIWAPKNFEVSPALA